MNGLVTRCLGMSLLLASCKFGSKSGSATKDTTLEKGTTCAAIRGNGPRIFSHFGALADLAEKKDIPLISGIAGGSSVTITAFLYESIIKNPLIDGANEDDKRKFISLLLKSLEWLPSFVGNSKPFQSIIQFRTAALELQKQATAAGVTPTPPTNSEAVQAQLASLQKILSDPENKPIADIVNPELVKFIAEGLLPTASPELKQFRLQEARAALFEFGQFSAKNPNIMFRPGLFNFDVFAQWMGFLGGFYSGMGMNQDFWTKFTSQCSKLTQPGKLFSETNMGSCQADYSAALDSYLKSESKVDRSSENVGATLNTLIGVSRTKNGDAIERFTNLKRDYRLGKPLPQEAKVVDDFESVEFAFFGNDDALNKLKAAKDSNKLDPYWSKVTTIPKSENPSVGTWHQALKHSPAEPGLDSAHIVSSSEIYFGGWSALFPVDALTTIGCDNVVFITRPVDVLKTTEFARDIARLLGNTNEMDQALYDPTNEKSSFRQNLSRARWVQCVDWDNKPKEVSSLEAFSTLMKTGYSENLGLFEIEGRAINPNVPDGCK